jgi:hypothetical protein
MTGGQAMTEQKQDVRDMLIEVLLNEPCADEEPTEEGGE